MAVYTTTERWAFRSNKTPAQAFTLPDEKIGTKWALCTTVQAGNMKSGYSKIFNATRAIAKDI